MGTRIIYRAGYSQRSRVLGHMTRVASIARKRIELIRISHCIGEENSAIYHNKPMENNPKDPEIQDRAAGLDG